MSNTYDNELEYKRYWLMVGLHPDLITELRAAVYQDEDTGRVRWRTHNDGCATPDGVAGWEKSNGERVLMYRRRKVYVASIVWLMHHGVLPPNGYVKYKDGNPRNLRIDNLFLKP
jgi:hypothetical protein